MEIDQSTQIGADGERHPSGTQPTDPALGRREVFVPPGGTSADVLTKASDRDFDLEWAPAGEGGGGSYMQYVGSSSAPVADAGTARPSTDGPVYWVCANGVTPTNALDGDLIWNADA